MNDTLAGASPVDQPVGRPVPKRYEGGRTVATQHKSGTPGRVAVTNLLCMVNGAKDDRSY